MLAADPRWPSTIALSESLPALLPDAPRAIVVVSAHWSLRRVGVTADVGRLPIVDEGVATTFFAHDGPYHGDPDATDSVVAAMNSDGIPVGAISGRGLDHGTLIPLRFMNASAAIPVVQISIDASFDPHRHLLIGRALRRLPEDFVVVASGGVVHNLDELERFAPASTLPPDWAIEFDGNVAGALSEPDDRRSDQLVTLMSGPGFERAHPYPDHYMPLLVSAGIGGNAHLIHRSWQWGSLSLASFAFSVTSDHRRHERSATVRRIRLG